MSHIQRMKELFTRSGSYRPKAKKSPRFVTMLTLDELDERVMPATRIWTGLGSTDNWTESTNWNLNTAPVAGDDLIFPSGAARANTNLIIFLTIPYLNPSGLMAITP
jgi:hypothetical protein